MLIESSLPLRAFQKPLLGGDCLKFGHDFGRHFEIERIHCKTSNAPDWNSWCYG